jgi:8-oxo-dGTP diphosphatase
MPKEEQGVTHHRYQVIPRTLTFIQKGDHVLMIKGNPTKRLWANRYNGIGGHVEKGEDIYASARRELQEEAGFDCEDIHLCGSIMIDVNEETGIHLFVFKGQYNGGTLKSSDEGNLQWISLHQLINYPLVEDLKIILPVIMELKSGEMLYGHYDYDEQEQLRINFIKH